MKITKFDKTNLRLLHAELTEAIKSVEEKHGIKLKLAGMSYTDSSFGVKINGTVTEGESLDSENSLKLSLLGLPTDIIGKSITIRGDSFKITGVDLKKRKNPILITKDNGKSYVCGVDTIKSCLKLK